MTKADFVDAYAKKMEISKKAAKENIDSLCELVCDVLADGDDVRLSGFGTFKTVKREARKGRNPQTGEEMDIPASIAPKFSFSSSIKAALNA